ncbi:MAG TPA: O-antigen ligase family protein [Candidatus Eremiobacteraceae bacterium]
MPLTTPVALCYIALAIVAGVLAYRATWTAGASLAATAPFAWYHALGPTLVTVSKAAFVGSLAGLLIAAIVRPQVRAQFASALRGDIAPSALIAFAILAVASIAWSENRPDAIRDALKWWWYAGAFCITAVAVRSSADAMKVASVLFIASAVVGLDGLWQSFTGAPDVFKAADGTLVPRIASTLEGPNQFGAYLETVIPVLLSVLLFARLHRIAFIAGALLLGLLTSDLLLSFSRGAFWACAAGTVLVVAAYIWTRRNADVHVLAALPKRGAVVAASVALFVIPVAGAVLSPDALKHEFLATPTATASMSVRGQLWSCADSLIASAPIFGVGAGNFADRNASCGLQLDAAWHGSANNWYLETAADLGFAGLALLAVFLGGMLLRARGTELWSDPIAVGAYGALLAIVLHGFVDDTMPFPKAALTFFIVIAMIPAMREKPDLAALNPAYPRS